jgi:protein SCO1/2
MGSGFLPYSPLGRRLALPFVLIAILAFGMGCEEDERGTRTAQNTLNLDVDETLTDTTYTLVNHDSATVSFPDDFVGTPVLLGAIYTECPNVCPKITANMKRIRSEIGDSSAVQLVSVTFDPHRDTPAQLAAYRSKYNIGDASWQFLTGDTTTIGRLMNRLGVRHTIKGTDREFPTPDTDTSYTYTHSNQITLIDAKGRVRATYGGSQTPPTLIVEDLQKIDP